MIGLLHELEDFSAIAVLICVFVVVLLVKEVREIVLYFKKWATEKEANNLSQEEINTMTQENHESIKKLGSSVEILQGKFSELSDAIRELKEDSRDNKRAELKDRIGQGYRFYSKRKFSADDPTPYWNEMEKDAFEDLISSYEHNGGKNSFVHNVVAAAIPTWIVVPNDYVEQ